MRLDKFDLNLFVVFDAIYRERSVTKVAALLNLTQPAVSNALQRLRQQYNDPLFVRTTAGMAPTPIAESLVSDIQQALLLLGKSVSSSARFDASRSTQQFRLAMNDMTEALLLAKIYQGIQHEAPKISLSSYYVERSQATEELKAGIVDILIDSSNVNARDLCHTALASIPYVCAVRPEHPLAGKRLSLKQYLAAQHVHVSSRRRGRGQVDIALHKLGHQREIKIRLPHYLAAAQLVLDSDLLLTLPQQLAQTLPLKLLKLPFAMESLDWNLYWHVSSDADPANMWLREKIQAAVLA